MGCHFSRFQLISVLTTDDIACDMDWTKKSLTFSRHFSDMVRMRIPIVPFTINRVITVKNRNTVVFNVGKGLNSKARPNHTHRVTIEVTIEFPFFQKQREKRISVSLPNSC